MEGNSTFWLRSHLFILIESPRMCRGLARASQQKRMWRPLSHLLISSPALQTSSFSLRSDAAMTMSKQIQYLSFSLLVTQTLFLLAPPSLASEPIAALISDRYQHLFASHLSWPGSNCSHPTPRQRSDLAALAVRLEDKTRSVVA